MKNLGWAGLGVVGVLAGMCVAGHADVYIPKEVSRSVTKPVQSAEEAISRVPVLRKVARGFFIGDGFKFKLSAKSLRIDHMASKSRAPMSRRTCMLSFHVASPVSFFGSTMDIPLANSASLTNDWSTSSFGDYVLNFSKDTPVETPTFGLKLSARF